MAHSKHDFPKGMDPRNYYQSDADFEKSVRLFDSFKYPEERMPDEDARACNALLPDVSAQTFREMKTKRSRSCSCGRSANAYDLIKYSVEKVSTHTRDFLTVIFNERGRDKKISIMDSCHKADWLPASVVYINDTGDIPCSRCGGAVHLYLLAPSIAHYWDGAPGPG